MYVLKQLWLSKEHQTMIKWQELLHTVGLSGNECPDYTVGIYDGDQLIASGSYEGQVIKYIAVCKKYQSEKLLIRIINHLIEKLREEGKLHYFIYTKLENQRVFRSLGFKEVFSTREVAFMELGAPNFNEYKALLKQSKKAESASGIVINANPFTKGHQYLVESAAKESEYVYLFVLSAEESMFSAADRFEMVKRGVAHLKNVSVLPTNDYLISAAVFPAYFLKEKAPIEQARIQATFDSQLFKEKIAPILHINKRFVGEETFSEVTNLYNQTMKEVFDSDISLIILPRLSCNGETISATKARQAIKERNEQKLMKFLPETTLEYLHQKGVMTCGNKTSCSCWYR